MACHQYLSFLHTSIQDDAEDPDTSCTEAPPFVFAQSLPCQPAVDPACSDQCHSANAGRLPAAAVMPLQGCGLVHMQSLALLIDCLRLYAGFGSCSRDRNRSSVASSHDIARLDQLLALLVTAEARASAMRVLLLASKPAVGRPDFVSAVQGEKSLPSASRSSASDWLHSLVRLFCRGCAAYYRRHSAGFRGTHATPPHEWQGPCIANGSLHAATAVIRVQQYSQ